MVYDITDPLTMNKEAEYHAKEWVWNAVWLNVRSSTQKQHPLEKYYLVIATQKNIHLVGFRLNDQTIETYLIDKITVRIPYNQVTRLYLSHIIPEENAIIYVPQFTDIMTIVRVSQYKSEVTLVHESYVLSGYIPTDAQLMISGLDGYYCAKRDIIVLCLIDPRGCIYILEMQRGYYLDEDLSEDNLLFLDNAS